MKHPILQILKRFIMMTIGACIYAFAISTIADPNSMAPGGVAGLSIIISRVIPVQTGTLIWCFNIPILLLGLWKFGAKFIVSTVYCTALTSVMTNVLSGRIPPLTNDILLAAIAGGVLMAIGIGMVFKAGSTTGGTDIIVKVLRLRFPHMKTSRLFLTLDAAVVGTSAFVFHNVDAALYAAIMVFVSSTVLDMVLYGKDSAKFIYIISDKSEQIAKRLLDELNIGVTYVKGVGAYSGKDKNVIMCVVKKHIAPKTEDVVKEEDPMAFMIVTSATEIYGEGYKNLFSEKI